MKNETVKLAEQIIKVLKVKASRGCKDPDWKGFENGFGAEFGEEIDLLIAEAEKIVESRKTSKL